MIILGSVVLLIVVGGVGYGLSINAFGPSGGSSNRGGTGSHHHNNQVAPLQVVDSTPGPGATGVASDSDITIDFSTPISLHGVTPTLSPDVTGTWQAVSATSIEFVPSAPLIPSVTETVTIPGGANGLTAKDGATLDSSVSFSFGVAAGDTLRLQQLLAQLNYLPLSFAPSGPPPPVTQTALDQPGTFSWKWSTLPPNLTSLWTEGQANVITMGALMSFQLNNHLATDAEAGPKVWSALLSADPVAASGSYNYVLVSKTLPQNLTLYEDGSPAYTNVPVNTGVPKAPTVDGTFPVFEHLTSSRMVGTNPDGTHYDDPHVPWASYFNGGDALHGFPRASYGFPQSDGCVEMAIPTAGTLWPLTPIGTLVTVEG
ncbi:MAG TPA: L,D-transpeptidase family protein [Actinomycetota bacterium]|nr:L,D-transpeptidase family protein [Actinomycetota bacterium]